MRGRLGHALCAAALALLVGCATLPGSTRIEIAQASFGYSLQGSADVTVVFEAGLGDGKTSWESVFEKTAVFARTLANAWAFSSAASAAYQSGLNGSCPVTCVTS